MYGILCVHLLWNENHLPRHSEKGKKTRQIEEEVGRQHQGMDRPGVRQVPESSGEQRNLEETGCEVICGAPTTLAVKGESEGEGIAITLCRFVRQTKSNEEFCSK